MNSWWCEYAAIDGQVEAGVTIDSLDGRITQIAAGTLATAGANRLAGLTVPGMANAHSHAFHRALRSRVQAERGTFWTWRDMMYTASERLDPDTYYRLARAVFAEMTLAGMSAVGEFHYLHHQPNGTSYDDANAMGRALLAAATDAGIRITLLDTLYLHGGLTESGYVTPSPAQLRFADRSAQAWVERVDQLADGGRHRIGAAIHSVRAVNLDSMSIASAWAAARDAPLHAHVSEQVRENEQCLAHHGCTPTALLHQAGALTSRFTAVHATHLSDHDVALLGDSGAAVCMCPTTEQDLGDGIGPSVSLVRAGVPLGLGSDSHAVIDHLIEARSIEMNERLRAQERGAHTATDLLKMATELGHRTLGWNDSGAFRVGNRTDLTTIALDTVRTAGAPAELAIEAAVFAATASDITSVVIDDEVVVADGHHRTIDVASELSSAIDGVFA
jgi:formiminoglutamate deiminase